MRIHDRYARVTPYEMALPGRAFAEERFELIREEADRRGVDIWDPGAFSMLEESRRAIADIRVEDENPVLFVQYGVILSAPRFRLPGRRDGRVRRARRYFLPRSG